LEEGSLGLLEAVSKSGLTASWAAILWLLDDEGDEASRLGAAMTLLVKFDTGGRTCAGLASPIGLENGRSNSQFCIHLKGEKIPYDGKHRKWFVGDGRRRPYEKFCFG